MDLEGIFALVFLAFHWRVTLCIVGSSALAILLVNTVPWITGLQGIAIAVLGFAPGAAWQARVSLPKPARTEVPQETTASVAAAAAALTGAVWGALSSTSMQSFAAGAVIFLVGAKAWRWCIRELEYRVPTERVYFCVAVAAFAYPIAALLAHNAL